MGDFEEVERLQAALHTWLLRTARSGRHELRDIGAPAVLPLLCAAAFGPALADGVAEAGLARLGVLSSVGADVLARLLDDAAVRARPARGSGEPASGNPLPDMTKPDMTKPDITRILEREIRRSVSEVLATRDKGADDLRSDIAMVMREIDAGGTVFRAAIETGDEELEREVLAAFEALSAEYGDMAFMLADLARAAGEIQDSLGGQGSELRAASEQVGRQSADVRMIREELAVIEQRTHQWLPEAAAPGPRWTGGCPYRGLLPYDQAHEAVFHGRERLTAELAGKLAGAGIVMVTGASGAGKTSLLQAGLVPALARGVQVPGSPSWPVISLTATARPLTDLAAGLASLTGWDPAAIRQSLAGWDPAVIRQSLADAPGEAHLLIREIMLAAAQRSAERLVLIIDQFEQVFTADGADGRLERAAFIDAVCAAAARPTGARSEPPARVVIAVRGDYWDRCAAYPQLVRPMEHDQLVVGPMPEAGLHRAIAGPAEASGLRVDSALIDAIVADVDVADAGPGGAVLPMLSQALMLTWEKRDGDRLTSEGYDAAGGVARAVEVSAEAVYAGLPEDQQAIARDMLRRMTAVGHDRRPVRRRVSRAELCAGRPKNQRAVVGAVLDAFAGNRLVMLGADAAEITHDIVLRAWPRLRDWLEEDQASLILYGQLAEDAARWRQNGKDSSRLYRGVQLAAAREATRVWAADPGRYPALTTGEAAFLRASGRSATRGRWGRRTLAGALVLLLVAALAGAGLAVRSARNSASQQRTANASERLAAQSTALEAADPVTAALLAGAAWRIAPTAQARYSLLQSLAQPVRAILAAQPGVVTAVAYGPDGKTLAAGYQDGTIRLWGVASHRLISTASWGSAALALSFTGGGRTLEVADPKAVGVWDLTNQAKITAQPLPGVTGGRCVAFSPDGATLATGGGDGNVRLWDAATRQEIGAPMSSDLKPVEAVAFSPDGATVGAASSDGTTQLWDAATQQEAGTTMVAGSAAVRALAFTPGGKFLATGGDDGNVRLWDVATQQEAGATMATGAPVAALAFDPGGTTLATAESDGATELWSFATQQQTGAALAAQGSGSVSALTFSPNASALATGDGNGIIELWNPAGFHQSSAPIATGTPEPIAAAAGRPPAVLSVRGDILAVSNGRGTVRLWNALTRRPAGQPIASHHAVTGLALSPDGKTLAVAAHGLQLWSTATGRQIGSALPAADAGGPVAFSPDGTMLAAIGTDDKVRLWNVATQRETGTAVTAGPGASQGALAFSPDGKIYATVGANGTAALWSVTSQRRIGALMTAAGQEAAGAQAAAGRPVYALSFSPDGATLATAGGSSGSSSGSIRLWDVATQQEIGAPMTAGAGPVYALAFSPDGATLATAGGDGRARLWNVAFPAGADLLAAACAIADRSLTPQQWADYAGTQPFRQVCPAG
ncbi:MAG: AAA family ATPase [Streptosporangiaceae bacterium]